MREVLTPVRDLCRRVRDSTRPSTLDVRYWRVRTA